MRLIFAALFLYVGNAFAVGTIDSGYIVPHGTSIRVSAHGACRQVSNNNAAKDHFFSAKTAPEWSSFRASPPSNVSLAACDGSYRSCLDYLLLNPGAPSGKYTIDVDGTAGPQPPFAVYCDMTTDGGGWTLVWSNTRGGTNKPVTNISWVTATTTTPLCSQANGSGTGCATYLSNNKEGFNYFLGLDWWGRITGNNKNFQMLYQWSTDYGQPIIQAAKFNSRRSNVSKLYSTSNSNYTALVGSAVNAGIYSFMGNYFSTFDLENDTYVGNCAAAYTGSPYWYSNCWSGSPSGGGEGSGGGYYNGAYWVGSASIWGASNGDGAGNGWIFVREHNYLSSCTEIKSKFPLAPDGLYTIDVDGAGGSDPLLVKCDMTTDGGGWTLVYNHNVAGGYFTDELEAATTNVTKPSANKYSILSYLESFRSIKGNFTFKISSPVSTKRNIWTQRTNPTVDQPVAGYVPISINMTAKFWGGLERNCGVTCTSSLMDGSIGTSDWWYAIGSYAPYGAGGIPYSQDNVPNVVTHTQLWVRDDSFTLKTPRDCQDVLEYGLSSGDGLYWVDPTSSGSSQQVYCDMTSDGGGWTLVFNQNYAAAGHFASAADALSKNPGTPLANHYSILNQLDQFKSNGIYIFKISWPGYTQRNIWAQTTNPTIDQPVSGYVPLSINSTSNYWGGLERNCAVDCASSLMDGSVNHSNWFYGIASLSDWGTPVGIPLSNEVAGTAGVPQARLWTRRAEGNFTKRSCKEILEAGLSTGNGTYLIDPDGVGGKPPLKVYCDMTTDGGGWTRVAHTNGTVTAATVPNDFLVNTYRRQDANLNLPNNAASINPEEFSKLVGTTDAMLKAPAYQAAPFIDNGLGKWDYNTARCAGTLLHTSRTAGCAGQGANDNFSTNDSFNIAFNGGGSAIVPYHNNLGSELCYSGKGDCSFEFFLR